MLYVSVSKLLPELPTSMSFLPTLNASPFIPFLFVNLSAPNVIASELTFLVEEILVSPILPTAMLPSLQ